MSFRVGDYVKKNPDTWKPNDFDSWGRGVGVGQIVAPESEMPAGEVDVRWPAGRCFEYTDQLLPVDSHEATSDARST
jgi:hypothetical protein